MTMITDVEDYFTKGCGRCSRFDTPECSARIWSEGQDALRAICLGAGLDETVKWGHPCYMHGTRNIALLSAFREDFRLTFFSAALMKDPEGILEKNGPNTQHPGVIYFRGTADVTDRADIICAYLAEAVGYADAGVKPPKEDRPLDLPEELVEVLDTDPELAEAFHALTSGRQRSYVINLNGAKTAATRFNRIAKFRDKIIAGKGAQER